MDCVALVVDVCRGNKKRRCLIAAARVATARGTFVSADFRIVAGAVVVATVAASWLLLQCQSSAFAFAADGVALGFLPALAFNTTLAFDRVVGHVAVVAVGEPAIEIWPTTCPFMWILVARALLQHLPPS